MEQVCWSERGFQRLQLPQVLSLCPCLALVCMPWKCQDTVKGISGWSKTVVHLKLAAKPCGASRTLTCFYLLFVSVYLGQKLSSPGLAFTELVIESSRNGGRRLPPGSFSSFVTLGTSRCTTASLVHSLRDKCSASLAVHTAT